MKEESWGPILKELAYTEEFAPSHITPATWEEQKGRAQFKASLALLPRPYFKTKPCIMTHTYGLSFSGDCGKRLQLEVNSQGKKETKNK
jgi:hypothetical protein